MSSALYSLYIADVIALARTMVIKCEGVAEAINAELTIAGQTVDFDDPRSWKYYMNLAGEYHFTDTEMTVRSVDTLQPMVFSKENLATNRATFREYQYGTDLYNDLVRRYPLNVHLINGILNPIDKTQAMDAEDGDILFYAPQFVESNETNLIPQLQTWIRMFFTRWYTPTFTLTDDLYVAAFLGVLYGHLPSIIMNLRVRALKTPYVHSFHVHQHLASNGQLHTFLPYLTQKQQLWLYRNVRYLQRNVGQQYIFDALVQNILTDRNIPLTWYRLRHNDAKMPEEIYPDVEMAKYPINADYLQSGVETATIHTILQRQRPVARDNAVVETEAAITIHEKMSHGQFSSLPTKVLESEMVDRTNSSVRSFENVLINEWVYMATAQRFTAFVNLPNPGSGELLSMTVRDALVVACYAILRLSGFDDVNTIPRVQAYDVLRTPLPTRDELLSLVPEGRLAGVVDVIQARLTPMGLYTSTEGFYNACNTLHDQYLRLWELYSFQDHMFDRAVAQQLVGANFMHITCALVDETQSFEQWFQDKGFAVADLSDLELEQLLLDAVNISTGANLVTRRSLAEIQHALLRLMGRLTSYTVQFLRNINEENYWYVKEPEIRPGDLAGETHAYNRIPVPSPTALRTRLDRIDHHIIPTDKVDTDVFLTQQRSDTWGVCVDVPVRLLPTSMADIRLLIDSVGILGVSVTVENDIPDGNELGQYEYPT